MAWTLREPSPFPGSFVARSILVVVAVVVVQLLASVAFYQAIDRQTLREDHARRIAEFLVVGDRVSLLEADLHDVMTSRYLEASIAAQQPTWPERRDRNAEAIEGYVRLWEPSLAGRPMRLWTENSAGGRHDLVGAMALKDGRWLTFRSSDFPRSWPIALRAVATTLVFSLACVALGAWALRQLGAPLRRLAQAARRIGKGPAVLVTPEGPPELADLGRAFNDMQGRITALIEDEARAMEALSHDLRTPLSRLKLASDLIGPQDVRGLVSDNVDELEEMLRSLSAWLRAQHQPSTTEETDLAALVQQVLARWPKAARYEGPSTLVFHAHRGPLEQALVQLVDNAVRHGGSATVRLATVDDAPLITVLDDGPGLSPESLARVYEPFFRGDPARARDTAGFGLGIPTADRLLRRFGGSLSIANRDSGGLEAKVRPPTA